MSIKINHQKGFAAYFIAILVLVAMIGIALSFTILTINEYKISSNIVKSSQAYFAAEAGIEDAILQLKKFLNVPPDYTIVVDKGSVEVSADSPSANSWVIVGNGNLGDAFRKLEAHLTISTINPEFYYGAQAGDLGIIMGNNSRVEGAGGVAGNIYSNGSVDGAPGATITGDVFVATGMAEDQSHNVYNEDQVFGEEDPIIDIAQSFSPSVSSTLTKISIYVKKAGNPGSRTVRILTDASGSPSTTTLASGTLQSSLVGDVYGWVDVVFASPPSLIEGNNYWIMVDVTKDKNKYWFWGKDKNQGYGNGLAKYVQDWSVPSPAWVTIIGDLNFKTFMGGQATFLDEVIVMGDAHANTISNSNICGDAYYQTVDDSSLNFLNNPSNPICLDPLTPGTANSGSSDPPLENMPISDSNINQWKLEAESGGVTTTDLVVDSDMLYGPKKIEGNLIMTDNNRTLTVEGTIYVTGHIDISNGSTIRCSPSYGWQSCVIVSDQWVHITNNGIFQGSGEDGSYIMILSASNCDGTPAGDCADFNAAMDLHNNAEGAIFYAPNGLIYIHNGVQISELTARKIELEPTAVVRYEQGLINASFSSGPGGGWTVASWKEIE